MRVDGIFLEVKPLLSSGLGPGQRVRDTLGREGLSVTDVSRENFLSGRKETVGRIGISFSESNNFINFECLENSNQTSGTRRFADRGKHVWQLDIVTG